MASAKVVFPLQGFPSIANSFVLFLLNKEAISFTFFFSKAEKYKDFAGVKYSCVVILSLNFLK